MILLLILVYGDCNALHTLETPIREVLLKPRNFNPHPYEQSYHQLHHQLHHHNEEQEVIDDINNIEPVSEDYVDNNVYNNVDGNNPSVRTTFPARHPANGIFRFKFFFFFSKIIYICFCVLFTAVMKKQKKKINCFV